MADFFIGEIRPFAFGFPPAGWMQCNGQMLYIAQYQALAALIGTRFGGDGKTTFQLPNIQGQVLIGTGQLTGGANYQWGQTGGATTVTITSSTMAAHTHNFNAVSGGGAALTIVSEKNTAGVNGSSFLSSFIGRNNNVPPASLPGTFGYSHTSPAAVALAGNTVSAVGTGGAHNNMGPYVTIEYCIAVMDGEWPSRD
ncbi:phage tail protein [Mucilaginibacter sp. AW1-3]